MPGDEDPSGTPAVVEDKDTPKAPKQEDIGALKHKAEKAEKELRTATESHQTAVTALEEKYNLAHQEKLQAEARNSSLEEERDKAVGSATELAEVKQQLEAATKSGEELTAKALEARKAMLVTTYSITPDSVEAIKSIIELDNFETALKAVTFRGIGNYATGGGGGGPSLDGKSPLELAVMAYEKSK